MIVRFYGTKVIYWFWRSQINFQLFTLHEPFDCLVFGEYPVEPGEDRVGVDVLVQVGQQISKHQTLLAGSVGRHPKPTVALEKRENNKI